MKQGTIGRSGKMKLISEDRKRSVEIWTKWCQMSQDVMALGAIVQKDGISVATHEDFMFWLKWAKDVQEELPKLVIEARTFIKEKIDNGYTK